MSRHHIIRKGQWVFTAALILAALVPTSVRAVAPGSLVRASQSAVYSIGSDGKRYAFPNAKMYHTWYADFSNVQRVSDTALAAIPLGGVVHYRPGIRLVKVPTDPKVYAVDRGGVLRWVRTEAVARALYGATWNRIVDDLPVEFIAQYVMGSPIDGHDDYDPEFIRRSVAAIDENRRVPASASVATPSVSPATSSPSVSLLASPSAPVVVIPPCTNQRFSVLPIAFDALESITPLGNLNPPGHVFPTDHTYWHLPGRDRGTWTLEPLFAPGDVTVTLIRSNPDRDESRTDGGDEYAIHFKLCEHVEGIFGHVKTLAPKLQQAMTGTSCNIPNWVECARAVSVRVGAGEQIGQIGGGVFRGLDLGVYDNRVALSFVNPQRAMHDSERYAVCPFEYFDTERRAQIDAKLPALVRGTCGAVMQDVPGTLAGNWFSSAVPFGTISKQVEQLAFSYEAREPARRVLSTGGQLGFKTFGPGFAIGPEQSSGRMNRAYRDVTPDGTIYCFQHTPSTTNPLHDKVLVQMVSRDELKIEYQQTPQLSAPDFLACKSDEQFVSPQMYRR